MSEVHFSSVVSANLATLTSSLSVFGSDITTDFLMPGLNPEIATLIMMVSGTFLS